MAQPGDQPVLQDPQIGYRIASSDQDSRSHVVVFLSGRYEYNRGIKALNFSQILRSSSLWKHQEIWGNWELLPWVRCTDDVHGWRVLLSFSA